MDVWIEKLLFHLESDPCSVQSHVLEIKLWKSHATILPTSSKKFLSDESPSVPSTHQQHQCPSKYKLRVPVNIITNSNMQLIAPMTKKKYPQLKWSNFQPSGLMRSQFIPTHKSPLTETMSCSIAYVSSIAWCGKKNRWNLLMTCSEPRQNVWECSYTKWNYNWFLWSVQGERSMYEKWSRGMKWYLWNNSYGCSDALTINSYKCFIAMREISSFFPPELRIDCPSTQPIKIFHLFHTFASDSSGFVLLIRLRVSCYAIFISSSKSEMFPFIIEFKQSEW